MNKYRKKPVVVEAVQLLPSTVDEIRKLASVKVYLVGPHHPSKQFGELDSATIDTLEGKMVASPGDWIIRGVRGELYPCKPDIFTATYERE